MGILMYEMVAGYPPFYDEDRVAMFRNICQVKYTVPSHFSKVCHHTQSQPCAQSLFRHWSWRVRGAGQASSFLLLLRP